MISGKSMRGSSAGSTRSRNDWLSPATTSRVLTTHTAHSLSANDAKIQNEISFIQGLEQKLVDREIARRQSSELLNKRWNDNVYEPIMSSIHDAMDNGSDEFSAELQRQYAHYLDHNNQSDGAVFLDVFNEHSYSDGDYQPLKLKEMQTTLITPQKVNIYDDPLKEDASTSRMNKTVPPNADSTCNTRVARLNANAKNGTSGSFWDKIVESAYNIESPERMRSRQRIKIEDINRRSQINWSEWYKN